MITGSSPVHRTPPLHSQSATFSIRKAKYERNMIVMNRCAMLWLFVSLFGNLANGLTPKICNYRIVNVYIERYPNLDSISRKKEFFKSEDRKLFEIKSEEWVLDSSIQVYIARIGINLKSSDCQETRKQHIYISKSCETIMLNKVQYIIPKNIKQAINGNAIINNYNLKTCLEM